MTPVLVWYVIRNGGDGSAYLKFFLSEKDAIKDEESQGEPFAESSVGKIYTYEGSDTHSRALSSKVGNDW